MELRLTLDRADLNRFRNQPILRTFKQGRPRNRTEQGLVGEDAEALPYRLNRSTYALAGGSWRADMTIVHGERAGEPLCFVDFRVVEGPAAPLRALLQALAEAVPFRVGALEAGSSTLESALAPTPVAIKSRPPPLQAGMTAAEALSLIATSVFSHLTANHQCLLQRDSAEAIHQMRVALRRLRSSMSMFKEMLDDPESEGLRIELRWLQQTLGAARDWDVLLTDTLAPLRESLGGLAGYDRLCELIAARRQQARGLALTELARPRLAKAMLQLAFWTHEAGTRHPLGGRAVSDLARVILEKRHRRVRRQMALFGELSVEGRHQCRIDIKKLRYAVDFFASLYPVKRRQRLLPLLAALQDRLGALNDVAVARDKLETLVLQDGSADLAWAAGQLIGWHAGQAGKRLDQIHRDWVAVEKLPAFWREPEL